MLQALLGVVPQHFGFFGIVAAASIVFFAYIGFDVVATTAEETRNPQRDMPRGILWSLGICAVLYMATAFVITGMANYRDLDTGAPLAEAFSANGVEWAARLISLGAICGITTVILVLLLGQSRVLFAMSRDRLLPPGLARVHPRYGTPWLITTVTGVAGRGAGRLRAAVEAVRADQHRHAVRVRGGLDRRGGPAPHAARPAALVPHAVRAGRCRSSRCWPASG